MVSLLITGTTESSEDSQARLDRNPLRILDDKIDGKKDFVKLAFENGAYFDDKLDFTPKTNHQNENENNNEEITDDISRIKKRVEKCKKDIDEFKDHGNVKENISAPVKKAPSQNNDNKAMTLEEKRWQ